MTSDKFWDLIEHTRCQGGDSEHSSRLENILMKLPIAEVGGFYSHFLDVKNRLFIREALVAGTLLNGGYCGDDGFDDFCNWLISRGRRIYELALTDFDSLAVLPLDNIEGEPAAMFEEYGYAAPKVHMAKSGKDISTTIDINVNINNQSLEDITFRLPLDEEIAQKFPMLWGKYGHAKRENDATARRLFETSTRGKENKIDVQGIGDIRVGSVLKRNDSKRCIVQQLFTEHGPMAKVLFEGQEFPVTVLISADMFSVDKF